MIHTLFTGQTGKEGIFLLYGDLTAQVRRRRQFRIDIPVDRG